MFYVSASGSGPNTDQERAIRAVLRRASAIPMILIALFGAVVLWQLKSRLADSQWVDHTDLVIATAEGTSLHLAEAVANLHGFLLIGEGYLLERCQQSYQSAVANVAKLKGLVIDHPAQLKRIDTVSSLLSEWKEHSEQAVALKRAGGDYQSILRSKAIVRHPDTISLQLSKFLAVEHEIRDQRSALLNRGVFNTVIVVALGALSIGALLVFLDRRDVGTLARVFRATLQKEADSRALAEQANRAKGQFLNTVSHELRNPLNSVLMWARALRTENSDQQRLERGLEAIERGALSQARLIDDLIDTARIESGKLRLDVRPVDVTAVVQTAIETVSLSAESKQIRIETVLDRSAGKVSADANRLQQIFLNLLSNAVKFTPDGGLIQVRLERIDSRLEISVRDSGRGIDPGDLQKIFGRFWQAEDGTQVTHGLGLGLSIAEHLAELHGGSITVASEGLGKGSIFCVRLPVMTASESLAALRRHPGVDGGVRTAQARHRSN